MPERPPSSPPPARPAAKTGPLVESGFQATLATLVVRMGTDHPHHTLPQLLALKNGNRGRDGRAADAASLGALSSKVDLDKVAAATEVLAAIAASSPAAAETVRQVGRGVGCGGGALGLESTHPLDAAVV